MFCKDWGSHGGGVGIYVRNSINAVVVLDDFQASDVVELICIRVKDKKKTVLIVAIYRSPSSNLSKFIDFVDKFLSFITPLYADIIVMGNLNVDQFSCNNKLNDCFVGYDFRQLITEPARIAQHSSTLIDVIFCNNSESISNPGVINADLISDHDLVYCELMFESTNIKPKILT